MDTIEPPVVTLPVGSRRITVDTGELLVPLIALVACIIYYVDTRGLPDQSLLYAEPLLYTTAALAVVTMAGHAVSITDRAGTDRAGGTEPRTDESDGAADDGTVGGEYFTLRSAIGLAVLTAGYVAGLGVTTFIVSTVAFLALALYMFGERNPATIVVYSVGITCVVWLVFVEWLLVPLP